MPSCMFSIIIIHITQTYCHQMSFHLSSCPCASTTVKSFAFPRSIHSSLPHHANRVTTKFLQYHANSVTNKSINSSNCPLQYHVPLTYHANSVTNNSSQYRANNRTNNLNHSSNKPPHHHTNCVSNNFTHVINSSPRCRTLHTNKSTNRVLHPPPVTGTSTDPSGGCYSVSIIHVSKPTVTHQYTTRTTSRHEYQLLTKSFSRTKREGSLSPLQ
jgi:hypothetical protein